jgi:hypothetical protein
MKLELKKEFILLAVVLAVYEPILKGAGNLIFNVGLFGLNAYGDYLIRRAALMTPPDISLYILAGGLSFFLGRTLARIFDVIPTGGLIPKDLTKKTDALVDRKKLELWAHCAAVLVTSYIVYSAVVQTRLCNAPLKVGQVPVMFRRLVDGVGCIG